MSRIIFSINSLDGSMAPDQHIVVLNVLEYIIRTRMTLPFWFQTHATSLNVIYVSNQAQSRLLVFGMDSISGICIALNFFSP